MKTTNFLKPPNIFWHKYNASKKKKKDLQI